MADPDQLARLRKGVAAWNDWRRLAPKAQPDLAGADLTWAADGLAGIDLSRANLRGATLNGLSLARANLYDCDFTGAHLVDADLSGADVRGANFAAATVDGIRYDRAMKCLGADVDSCNGSARFKRHVLESDYIESFAFEHPFLSAVWRATSDCSRSLGRTAAVGLVIILVFAGIYVLWPATLHWSSNNQAGFPARLFSAVYYSVNTFTTHSTGNAYPSGTAGEIITTLEGILGYVWLGYLISVFAQRATARV